MVDLYFISKKIHRFLTPAITVMIVIMAGTGFLLKYPKLAELLNFDFSLIRFIHNNLSLLFTVILLLMMITGLIMYLFPLLKKRG